jgi:hypothetical protein
MPSTYTLNNGIELIATGEQSGTWGDTTNVNLGLIDTALDGQVTITLASAGSSGSPNTLAISDGSASNGRNRLVIFADGGDLGATAFVQLTPNDAEKIVYIRNDLSGGRAITLFQGTYNASNDYEVPAGTTAVVFFNGGGAGAVAANVFNNAFFDSLRLGGVSVTAILDEDNMASDSATALATQQSIKAYVDAQVGANNELSEILANGNTSGGNDIQMTTTDEVQFRDTALKINSSVDGQLDIAADVELEIVAPTLDINASTAVTIDTTTMTMTGSVNVVGDLDVDNLNINGNSIISTNTDGNIALTPNGTGEVDISKVDIDGGTIDGTVIGGSTPAAISGTTGTFSGAVTLSGGTANGVAFLDSSKALTTGSALTFDGSTLTNTRNTTDGSAAALTLNNGGASGSFATLNLNAGPVTYQQFADAAGNAIGSSGVAFRTTSNHPLVFGTNNTERLRIANTGDISFYEDTGTTPKFFWDASAEALGIGTSSPNARLAFGESSDIAFNTSLGSTGTYGSIKSFNVLAPTDPATNIRFIRDVAFFGNDGAICFDTVNTERMRIDSSGNVGIGTSSPAAAHSLEVSGNQKYLAVTANAGAGGSTNPSVSAGLFFSWNRSNGVGESNIVYGTGAGSSPALQFASWDGTTYSERMRIDSSGNVGIGTSAPTDTLHISKASTVTTTGISTGVGLKLQNSSATDGNYTSIQNIDASGDQNAEIKFINVSQADQQGAIAFTTRSAVGEFAEKVRIDSSGNVGIGTSSPAGKFHIAQTNAGGGQFLTLQTTDSTQGNAIIRWQGSAGTNQAFIGSYAGTADTGNLEFGNGSTTNMILTSAGNVGIGTSSPRKRLEVTSTAGPNALQSQDSANSTNFFRMYSDVSSGAAINVNTGGIIRFAHSDEAFFSFSERMRIDASGNLLVGTTSAAGTMVQIDNLTGGTNTNSKLGIFGFGSGLGFGIIFRPAIDLNATPVLFENAAGTEVGSISTLTGTSTAYVTTSDYRLKEDVQPMAGSVDRLMALKPVNFAWKVHGSRVDGFLAHEAQEVVPECVTGEKDAVDKDGKPKYQGIDQSKLVPLLTAALQEALTEIADLKARVAALEA